MATAIKSTHIDDIDLRSQEALRKAMRTHAFIDYLVPVGRVFFAAIFIFSSFAHFTRPTIDYAINQGVPLASLAVPVSGIMALLGGLSILTGYGTKIGAWLIILFLIPVTLMMHNFWAVSDPGMRQIQQIMFLKNTAMLGGAIFLAYFGAGPFSFDSNRSSKQK